MYEILEKVPQGLGFLSEVSGVTEKVLVVLELHEAPFLKCLMSLWVIKDDEGGYGGV